MVGLNVKFFTLICVVFHGADKLENIDKKGTIDKYFKNFNLKKLRFFVISILLKSMQYILDI